MRISNLNFTRALHGVAIIVAVQSVAMSIAVSGAVAATQYVSAAGNDANTCLLISAPCATFPRAHSQAADGDLISCLGPSSDVDPSTTFPTGYGVLTITKAITVDCALGGGGNAAGRIIISAPGKAVRLQNLEIHGRNFGDVITITDAAAVHLENIRVTRSPNDCLNDQRSTPGKLTIVDSIFRDCTTVGLLIVPGSGTQIDVTLDNVRSYGNAYGLAAGTGSNIAIKRSVFSGNTTAGVEGDTGAQITVDGSTVTSNGIGIQSSGSIRLSNNNIAFNTTAITGASASFGSNRLSGNGAAGTAPTPLGATSTGLGQQ